MEAQEPNRPTAPPRETIDSPDSSLTLRPTGTSGPSSSSRSRSVSPEGLRPPLPPRPGSGTIGLIDEATTNASSSSYNEQSPRPNLQSKATTALSLKDVSGQTETSNSKDGLIAGFGRSLWGKELRSRGSFGPPASQKGSETGDSASIVSYAQHTEEQDDESIFGDLITTDAGEEKRKVVTEIPYAWEDIEPNFVEEFEPLGELDSDGQNEEILLKKWKAKRKHYLILSAAGKPIYTRHGDGGLISGYIGIIQTIISFYKEGEDTLKAFLAGNTKFVIMSRGPLHLVAISRLLESEYHLRLQLDALYLQILSTLTLPTLTHLFSIRPSTDLKRPLQGTETLLSSLADSFTKGSPVTLLSALECLRIRKAHRQTINNALLKTRVDSLLYGLVVAGGRLVSVIRPKKHSLHPGDLQLLFNMIFEADGVKAGGGESWIPVCLPGFNSSGYLYMYVSFVDLRGDSANTDEELAKDESVAIILISTDKESFFRLQEMRNALIEHLEKAQSLKVIKEAIEKGRPSVTDIVPGTVLRHFIYKSKAHVQFAMSTFDPEFLSVPQRRRLISIYNALHDSVHARHTHVKVQHSISKTADSFAWVTPIFELYCVAGPNANRKALAQSANKVVQWIHREEERLFIVGGAVF